MTLAAAIASAALAAAAVTFAGALLLRRGARHLGLVDPPGERKLQRHAVPLVGGALFGGLFIGATSGARFSGIELEDGLLLALATPLLCFAIGIVDDARAHGLQPRTKALASAVALLPALLAATGGRAGLLAPATLGLALAAVAALHATNTVDHAHGLCGLVTAAGGAAVAWNALRAGEPTTALLAAVVAATAFGFLLLNYPRGRVFLGDSGSLLLGGCFAAATVVHGRCEWLLLAAVPLADLASVALLRLKLRLPPWRGDRRHVTHRLARFGLAEPAAVALLALLQAACSAWAAPLLFAAPGEHAPLKVAGVIGLLALGMLLVPLPREPASRAAP
jgi:UDP-N-acetylmuramyl pentapeptide phosphotransferase/UDP-N-acetylglucosamine-1-phosphate transferase